MLRGNWWLAVLGIVGVAAMVGGAARPIGAQETTSGKSGDKGAGWQSVAPGVVEPVSGEIKIVAAVVGRVGEVSVAVNDKVVAGEPVLRLDDEDARARVATARACASGCATTNLPAGEKIDATRRMTLPVPRRHSVRRGPRSRPPRWPSEPATGPTP